MWTRTKKCPLHVFMDPQNFVEIPPTVFVDTQKAFPQYHIHGINTWAHEQHVSGKQNKAGDPESAENAKSYRRYHR